MPIYEYKCEKCGSLFEQIQKFSDNQLKICGCEKKGRVVRLISSSSFRLKGTGWYETDFKTGKKKNLAKNDDDKPANKDKTKDESPKKKEQNKKKEVKSENS